MNKFVAHCDNVVHSAPTEHQATQLLLIVLSVAASSASSHFPRHFDVLKILVQCSHAPSFFLGDLFFFPSRGFQVSTWLVNLSPSMRSTLPNQRKRSFLIVLSKVSIPVLLLLSHFVLYLSTWFQESFFAICGELHQDASCLWQPWAKFLYRIAILTGPVIHTASFSLPFTTFHSSRYGSFFKKLNWLCPIWSWFPCHNCCP